MPEYSLLKYYDIQNNNSHDKKSNAYILGGEHPRELVSSELVFNFVKYLCENRTGSAK